MWYNINILKLNLKYMDNTMMPAENKHKKITTTIIILVVIGLLIFIAYSIQKNRKSNQPPVNTETGQSADGLLR